MISSTALSMRLMQAAANEPGINYSVSVERDDNETVVGVRFSGLLDDSHAELFAQYIVSLLELNIERGRGYAN